MWASQVRVVDVGAGSTLQKIPMAQNEAVSSLCLVRWAPRGESPATHVVVGGHIDMHLSPRTCGQGFLDVYKITGTGNMELLHRTIVDGPVGALCSFSGRVLAGVGRTLRLYELGRRKLLRKCENRHVPNLIIDIQAMGQRVYVSDIQESVFCVRYKKRENQLIIFADDTHPRYVNFTLFDHSF